MDGTAVSWFGAGRSSPAMLEFPPSVVPDGGRFWPLGLIVPLLAWVVLLLLLLACLVLLARLLFLQTQLR